MKWKNHDKWWCKKLSISDTVSNYISNYINRAIDNLNMPKDFKEHTFDKKIPIVRHGKISSADIIDNLHDRGKANKKKNRVIIEEDLKFLLKKGKDYIKAYYLHFILDYLVKLTKKEDSWVKTTGETIEDCINKYKKNQAVTLPETEEQLIEVMNFLKKNIPELKKDLNL